MDQLVSKSLWRIAEIHRRRNDWESALRFLERSLPLAECGGDLGELADQYLEIEKCYVELAKFEEAERYLDKYMTLARELSDRGRVGRGLVARAFIQNSKGEFKESLELKLRAKRIFEDGGYLHDLANVMVLIAVDLIQLERNEEAMRFLEEAIVLSRRIGDIRMLAYSLWTVAGQYISTIPNFLKGERYLSEATALFQRLGERQQMGMIHFYRAIIARQKGDWPLAEDEYRRALGILRKHAAPELLTDCYLHYASALLGHGDRRKARVYYERADRLIQRGGFSKFLPAVRKGLRATEPSATLEQRD
jgi:tetratricopeptide (TPR) repeat protein